MKHKPKNKITPARIKKIIQSRAVDFAEKAKKHHEPGGSKNLSEYYSGCVHGIAVCCQILNLEVDKVEKLLEELSSL